MLGSKKIKLLSEQYELVDNLSKDVGMKKDELAQGIFEMGLTLILAIRKGKWEEAQKIYEEKVKENPEFRRFCARFEFFYERGA